MPMYEYTYTNTVVDTDTGKAKSIQVVQDLGWHGLDKQARLAALELVNHANYLSRLQASNARWIYIYNLESVDVIVEPLPPTHDELGQALTVRERYNDE